MGQIPHRVDIVSISNTLPCVIVTTEEHGFATGNFVRFTNLNYAEHPVPDMYPLQNNRYEIIVRDSTSFSLQDPITHVPIDSTTYPPYVESGFCNKIEPTFFYYNDEDNNG